MTRAAMCASCEYFVEGPTSTCHRYAPRPYPDDGRRFPLPVPRRDAEQILEAPTIRPAVRPDEFCGEYARRFGEAPQ